jgi:hypothetical protein
MLHWYERTLIPVIGGGLVYLYGLNQRQNRGYRTFVNYFAVWVFGLFTEMSTYDLILHSRGAGLTVAMVWTVLVSWALWKRHLA